MKQRDYSIDILKCLAALLITYSHLDPLLGKYAVLATGGSFGDCLFFFCSGYTLLLSQKKTNFFNWYKRRINRIYPTVFAWAFVCACFFHGNRNMAEVIVSGGGFFVSCIMIFYILFYPIKRYILSDSQCNTTLSCFNLCVGGVIILLSISYITLFFCINSKDPDMMYRWQWSLYFIPMLMGAMLGKMQFNIKSDGLSCRTWKICIALSFSVIVYYILAYLTRADSLLLLKPLVILPQLGVTFFFICYAGLFMRSIYCKKNTAMYLSDLSGDYV